jgi:hypothetical protein
MVANRLGFLSIWMGMGISETTQPESIYNAQPAFFTGLWAAQGGKLDFKAGEPVDDAGVMKFCKRFRNSSLRVFSNGDILSY